MHPCVWLCICVHLCSWIWTHGYHDVHEEVTGQPQASPSTFFYTESLLGFCFVLFYCWFVSCWLYQATWSINFRVFSCFYLPAPLRSTVTGSVHASYLTSCMLWELELSFSITCSKRFPWCIISSASSTTTPHPTAILILEIRKLNFTRSQGSSGARDHLI